METYKIKTKKNMKLVVPNVIDEKGVTFRSTCRECGTLGRRKSTAYVLDVMAAEVQKDIITKSGELHKPYVTYTAVVASCDDHWMGLTGTEKEELALLVGKGNILKDGRHYFVKCHVFETTHRARRITKRRRKTRTFRYNKTAEVVVERLWVRADFIDEYCSEMASAGRIVKPVTE